MSAIITPTNASNKAVTWSVEAGTGTASISEDGLLTALTNGTVTVKVTATDGSAKFGTKVITISNQLAPNQDQEAPTGLAGLAPTSASNDDGKITGTTTAMEYKLAIAEDAAYVTATDSEVAGLAAGDYVVRLAAKEGFNASPTTAVTVDVYLGADVTLSDLTVDGITIEGFNSDIFNYKVEVASGTIIVPTVAATVSAMGKSNAIVTATESLPGTTTVLVTAENGETQIYTVDFEEVIGIASIEGVTAPVAGKVPVKTVTETDQYIGVITWTPGDDLFGVELVYTAEITLEAKLGYTLTGVAENFFTVEGATATNEANKGIVTAVFPKTDYYLAGDSDFSGEEDGHFKYIGTASYVEIPNTIKGKEITSYKNMFAQTSVKGVKSSNPNIINMSYMFYDSSASSLDLSDFNTSNVTDMSYMFTSNDASSLDLSSFDTANVTDMSSMFRESKATSIDLSSFDTSKLTNMEYMFNKSKASSLDLSGFNTSNVTNMASMFSNSQVTSLDLSSFDTFNVIYMEHMFSELKVATLDLRSFDTSNVTNTSYMFSSSQATTGYARTPADVNKFNASSEKPTELIFTVR